MAYWGIDRPDGFYLVQCPACFSLEPTPQHLPGDRVPLLQHQGLTLLPHEHWGCLVCDATWKIPLGADEGVVNLSESFGIERVLPGPDTGEKEPLVAHGEGGKIKLPKALTRDLDPTGVYGHEWGPYVLTRPAAREATGRPRVLRAPQHPRRAPNGPHTGAQGAQQLWNGALAAFRKAHDRHHNPERAWMDVEAFLRRAPGPPLGLDQQGELYTALLKAVGVRGAHVAAFALLGTKSRLA
jgi:hypothetical protein